MIRCEWNPSTSGLARTSDEPHGEAKWLIGKGVQAKRLCDQCVKLKKFSRHKPQRLVTTAEVMANFQSRMSARLNALNNDKEITC